MHRPPPAPTSIEKQPRRGGTCLDVGRSREASAFTLIELLTVIAIIGILAAIIIPVTGKVRAMARKTKCLSNTRQIGLAFLAYAGDNKDALPVQTASLDSSDPDSWVAKISYYTGGHAVFTCTEYRAETPGPIPVSHRLYNEYVSRKSPPGTKPVPTRITQSNAPGRDVLMIEQTGGTPISHTLSSIVSDRASNSWWHYPHPGQGTPVDPTHPDNVTRCVLYVDAHARQLPRNGIPLEHWTWPPTN
ncbi:type II secretion system protein [Geminisphaera colitermitum]|uniref:type II secretion system protein n=1 Tax=Geminisphaera colitermitum TaxID=1148786 RepID=UPI000694F4EF|nr:DUF1559 domain-containing protein [Geminisphaera colitermitum]